MYKDLERQKNYEKILLINILRKWRRILLAGIILGILLGGSKLAMGVITWNDKMDIFEKDLEIYYEESALYEEQLAELSQEKENYQESLERQQEYVDHSILMNMDARNKVQVTADILVTIDSDVWIEKYSYINYDPTDSLVALYYSGVKKDTDWEKVASICDISPEYVSELVSVTENLDSNTFTIRVSHPDSKVAEDILDEIVSELSLQYNKLASNIGSHKVVVGNKVTETVYDPEVFEYQKTMKDMLDSYRKAVNDYQEQIDNLMVPLWPSSEPSRRQICFSALGFGIVGFIIGVLILICWSYFVFVYGGKLHSEDELKELGIKYLGRIPCTEAVQKKKRMFLCIDKWIDKLAGFENGSSDEMEHQLLVLNIQNHVGSVQKVFITGNVDENKLHEVGELMVSVYPDMEINIGINMDKDVESYKMAMTSDGVILVAKKEYSKPADILQEKEFTQSINKNIIGCILV